MLPSFNPSEFFSKKSFLSKTVWFSDATASPGPPPSALFVSWLPFSSWQLFSLSASCCVFLSSSTVHPFDPSSLPVFVPFPPLWLPAISLSFWEVSCSPLVVLSSSFLAESAFSCASLPSCPVWLVDVPLSASVPLAASISGFDSSSLSASPVASFLEPSASGESFLLFIPFDGMNAFCSTVLSPASAFGLGPFLMYLFLSSLVGSADVGFHFPFTWFNSISSFLLRFSKKFRIDDVWESAILIAQSLFTEYTF